MGGLLPVRRPAVFRASRYFPLLRCGFGLIGYGRVGCDLFQMNVVLSACGLLLSWPLVWPMCTVAIGSCLVFAPPPAPVAVPSRTRRLLAARPVRPGRNASSSLLVAVAADAAAAGAGGAERQRQERRQQPQRSSGALHQRTDREPESDRVDTPSKRFTIQPTSILHTSYISSYIPSHTSSV